MHKAITILFLFCSITLNAQLSFDKPYKLYKVHMNDTRVFRGELIIDTDEMIAMKLLDGTTVELFREDIYEMIQFNSPFPKITNYKYFDDFPNGSTWRVSGPYIIFQLGFIPDRRPIDDEEISGIQPTFTVINGYQFEGGNALGLGINFDVYNRAFFPVFIDYRQYITKDIASFYSSFNLGYALSIDQLKGSLNLEQKGGIMVQVGAGFRVATKKDMNFIFELGYRLQRYKSRDVYGIDHRQTFKHLIFQAGVLF